MTTLDELNEAKKVRDQTDIEYKKLVIEFLKDLIVAGDLFVFCADNGKSYEGLDEVMAGMNGPFIQLSVETLDDAE